MTGKFKAIILLSMVVSTGLCLWISFVIHNTKVEKDKNDLTRKIDKLFQSKNVIADGQISKLSGKLQKRGFTLYSGGFTIYRLSKESSGFVKTVFKAGDINYKEDEFDYSYGFKMSTYRKKPLECYNEAFEFILFGSKENRKNSYTENTFTEIKDFPEGVYSEFHSIKNVQHPTEFYFRQEGSRQVQNSSWGVKYSQVNTYYAIQADREAIQKSLNKYLSFGLAVALVLTSVIFLILRFLIPSAFKRDNILNKKWKDIEGNFIMTLEPKLFGKHAVTVIENEKVKKGIAKFSENGTQLQLSLPETELFYKIRLSEDNKLEVENMTTNKISCFEKLGSNAYKKEENVSVEESNEKPLTELE